MTRPLDDTQPSLPVEDIPAEPVPITDETGAPTGQYVAFELQSDGYILARDMPDGWQPAPEVNPL